MEHLGHRGPLDEVRGVPAERLGRLVRHELGRPARDLGLLVVHRGADASLGWVRRLAPLALLILVLLGPTAFGCVCPAGASAQAVPANFFGMMVNGPLDSPKTDLMAEDGVMKAAGVESQRVAINWDRVQPDRDAPPDWSAVDRKVLAAA